MKILTRVISLNYTEVSFLKEEKQLKSSLF